MKQDVIISSLTLKDIEQHRKSLESLLKESYDISFKNQKFPKEYFANKIKDLETFIQEGKAISFIARINNKMVGFIWGYTRIFLEQKRIHINHFVVNNKFQGFGIGRELNNQIENYARENNIDSIDLMVTLDSPSVKFYEHFDYKGERIQMIKKV